MPVSIDNDNAVRMICPPPSPVLPSIFRMLFEFDIVFVSVTPNGRVLDKANLGLDNLFFIAVLVDIGQLGQCGWSGYLFFATDSA